MFLGAKRQDQDEKRRYKSGATKSCIHRQTNCRTNACRASASLGYSRRPAGGVCAHREERSNRRFAQRSGYSLTDRSRSAFAITETELKLIAAPAIIGLRRIPNSG